MMGNPTMDNLAAPHRDKEVLKLVIDTSIAATDSSGIKANDKSSTATAPTLQPPSAAPAPQVPMLSPTTQLVRKVEDESVSIQRLVDYFVVVSSHPRWIHASSSSPQPPRARKGPLATSEVTTTTTTTKQTSERRILKQHDVRLASTRRLRQAGRKRSMRFLRVDIKHDKPTEAVDCDDDADDDADHHDDDKTAIGASGSELTNSTCATSSSDPLPLLPNAIVSPRSTWKREEGTDGNIHMPQASASQHDFAFQPKITARYPPTDYEDNPLNPMVVQFCYPSGDVIVPSRVYEMPRVHHFVLTNDRGRKVYGTCLTFYDEYVPSSDTPWNRPDQIHGDAGEEDIEVTRDPNRKTLYIPRVLCLLSTWPYLGAFREYISQLYRLATTTNVMSTPIERHIINICMEIPAPPPGAFEVQVSILNSTIRFWAPPAKLPLAYVALPYQTLFDCLDLDNVLLLWYALSVERKVLLLSSSYSILTICSEILSSMLFPMRWSHLYVPLLPRFLCPMLDAPVPYLCGITRENWLHAQQFVNEETIVVDLDRNSVAFGEKTPDLPPVPNKKWLKLQTMLRQAAGNIFYKTRGIENEGRLRLGQKMVERAFGTSSQRAPPNPRWTEKLQNFDHAFNLAYTPDSPNLINEILPEQQQSQSDQIQEAFLRFYVAMLKDYRKFLFIPDLGKQPEVDPNLPLWSGPRSFDRNAFIASQKPEYTAFLNELCLTQHFDEFITKRLYSPGEPDIIFFDQSIDAKLNRSRLKVKKLDTPFLHTAKAHKVLTTLHAIEPNAADLPQTETGEPFVYKTWPETFETDLFCEPRPIPRIITAEFDRQAALVSRLRANYFGGDERNRSFDIPDFVGGDFDTSPQVAAFTVFFYTYCSVIGREWQQYQKRCQDAIDAQTSVEVIEIGPVGSYDDGHRTSEVVEEQQASKAGADCFAISKSAYDACSTSDAGILERCCGVSLSGPTFTFVEFANSVPKQQQLNQGREASLLDGEDEFAEYEETREVAAAQLDLAFQALTTMTLRGLSTDPDAFRSLMEACGRCGDTQRALELMEKMRQDGLVADNEILSCFMAAFAQQEEVRPVPTSEVKKERQTDAYTDFLMKKLEASQPYHGDGSTVPTVMLNDDGMSDTSVLGSDISDQSERSIEPTPSIFEWFTTPLKRTKPTQKRRRRRRATPLSNTMAVTDSVQKQVALGESLLDFLYPELIIDTNIATCPQCSCNLTEDHVVAGWLPCQFEDFTSLCPNCKHRFIPHFTVLSSADDFEGSQGKRTPLYCEFLSPWVLRKEFQNVLHKEHGIDDLLDPEWRSGSDIRATLWWNMILLCRRYRLPFTFLLQGSFHNRLINPIPETA